jgi:hypothetical protein
MARASTPLPLRPSAIVQAGAGRRGLRQTGTAQALVSGEVMRASRAKALVVRVR